MDHLDHIHGEHTHDHDHEHPHTHDHAHNSSSLSRATKEGAGADRKNLCRPGHKTVEILKRICYNVSINF